MIGERERLGDGGNGRWRLSPRCVKTVNINEFIIFVTDSVIHSIGVTLDWSDNLEGQFR